MLYAQIWPERGQRIQHLAANEEENELFEKARTAPAGDMRGVRTVDSAEPEADRG